VEMVLAASALLVVTLWIGFRHLGIGPPIVGVVSLLVLGLAGAELATRTVSRLEVVGASAVVSYAAVGAILTLRRPA
jgi:hypothetical protein